MAEHLSERSPFACKLCSRRVVACTGLWSYAACMEDFQQRVVAEKAELDERLGKLQKFIASSPVFAGLPVVERDLLERQQTHMVAYSAVLGERIASFEVSA